MTCMYCHKTATADQEVDVYNNHISCWKERNERYNNNMCARCNKNNREASCNVCSNCESNNSDYQGYEGPRL